MISEQLFKIQKNFQLINDVESYIAKTQVQPKFNQDVYTQTQYNYIWKIERSNDYYMKYLSQTEIGSLLEALEDF